MNEELEEKAIDEEELESTDEESVEAGESEEVVEESTEEVVEESEEEEEAVEESAEDSGDSDDEEDEEDDGEEEEKSYSDDEEKRGWSGRTLTRTFAIDRSLLNEEERTVKVAFSSELPVERGWGIEVLDHSPDSIRTERLNDGAPLLLEHDPSKHIGVIEGVSIGDDRVARALVRFGNSALAEETFRDVKDGIKRHISVGYVIHEVVQVRENEQEVYRATDWTPLEVSWVSVPADHSVGIGRSNDLTSKSIKPISSKEVRIMSNTDKKNIVEDVRANEMARIKDLESLGSAHGQTDLARDFINNGKSVDEFRTSLLNTMANKPAEQASANIGLSASEQKRWSLMKIMRHLANPNDARLRDEASFEIECSEASAKLMGREARGVMMPFDVMNGKRDIANVASLVETVHGANSFVDVLTANSVVFPHVTKLTGLQGDLSIPRMTAGTSTAYVAESASVAETTPTFDSIAMSPSTLGTFTQMSRKMLIQSDPSVEQMVMNDFARAMAVKIDETILYGSGSGAEPTGILNLGSMTDQLVVNGDNGLLETWAKVVEYESNVNAQNADGNNMKYVLHPSLAGAWKTKAKDTGSGLFNIENGMANGYEVLTTTVLPANLTKGSNSDCFGTVFGDFSSAIFAMWGGLDIMADPYTGSASGTLRLVGLQDVDFAVRHKESFAISKDSRTA